MCRLETHSFATLTLLVVALVSSVSGCSSDNQPSNETPASSSAAAVDSSDSGQIAAAEYAEDQAAADEAAQTAGRRFNGVELTIPRDVIIANPATNAERQAFFGDLHVHTEYSFDAFAFGTIATPYDAYDYAQGKAIRHPGGFDVQLREPLDFYAVTDHAMFLGAVKVAADTSSELSKLDFTQGLHNINAPDNLGIESLPQRFAAFSNFLPNTLSGINDGTVDEAMINNIIKDAWADIIRAAETHNKPGEFTTFVAYEYTSSTDDRGNLHRNVIFRDADKLPAIPFSRFHSQDPEGLWDWLDDLRSRGMEALAIPHNSNGSNGQMFKLVDWAGDPLDDDYNAKRARNEPLVEITQIKGTSETHPLLSTTDEWADFEIMPYRVATTLASEPSGSYARDALLKGMIFEDKGMISPYRFGFVGASDTHTGAASLDEEGYFSKAGLLDSDGERRGSLPLAEKSATVLRDTGRVNVLEIGDQEYASGAYETWGASGLTGVWAEENTRDAIYRAFRRKETFATSGPRIRLSFFAGYELSGSILDSKAALVDAYRDGVSMGSDLLARAEGAPSFVAWANQDPGSAPLQRLQIVKGWTVDGEANERVFDIACSGGAKVDPATHRCPDNGASVDISDCSTQAGTGAAELKALWQDPEFDAQHRAFYYVRVLENPTCRWSTWDAIKAGVTPRDDLQATLQERAWTSSIWYVPAGA